MCSVDKSRCQVCGAFTSSIEQRCRHVGDVSVAGSDDRTTASTSL
jgi:hypothetical protein